MSTQVYFFQGCEPPDIEFLPVLHEESCFGQVILHGNLLHQYGIDPFFQRHHPGRITLEKIIGKSIYLVKGKFHSILFF